MTAHAHERPDWRQVNISLLAGKLYAAFMHSEFHEIELKLEHEAQHVVEAWYRAAEAAVDELIDKPDREFQAQLDALLASSKASQIPAKEWRELSAGDWL